jgi:1,4-alpha-glucan branching enzyme
MRGYVSLILHAHLPFVRHPAHERFLEESWLYEAITESYLPLLRVFEGWRREGITARVTLTLSPTLCGMLEDAMLRQRYERHLETLIDLSERESFRTQWEPAVLENARFYRHRFQELRDLWRGYAGDLIAAFRDLQQAGILEVITTAATHPVLPLLIGHPSSIRGQLLTARDDYRRCFGCDSPGIWLPECAYHPGLDGLLREAGFRWFIVERHGLLHAKPRPRYGVFAPVFTPAGLAVFGRDGESARQVWSRDVGYPGDSCYRDFYRDVGFDLEFEYVRPALPSPDHRGFTGLKYHRIGTETHGEKGWYRREPALQAVREHAGHFLASRIQQMGRLASVMGRPPIVVCPYDAELFGHWWYEGPEFLDRVVREGVRHADLVRFATPTEYLRENPTQQVASPAESSWGEEGFYRVWLNETNEWVLPHLDVAMERMHRLAGAHPAADALTQRALNQAARELLLAQSSDWTFILRTGTNPTYARQRVTQHLLRFIELHEQLTATRVDPGRVAELEALDPVFPGVDYTAWS